MGVIGGSVLAARIEVDRAASHVAIYEVVV
jgi:hypothetical protein